MQALKPLTREEKELMFAACWEFIRVVRKLKLTRAKAIDRYDEIMDIAVARAQFKSKKEN